MPQLVLQPIGDKGRRHYHDTILTGVPYSVIEPHLPADSPLRTQLAQQTTWKVWGVVSTPGGINRQRWNDLQPGATALFYLSRHLIASAQVVAKFRHADLARELWGVDETDLPWENLYFLADHQPLNLPVETLQPLMGWGPNGWVRSFMVLENDRAERVLTGLGQAAPALAAAQAQRRLQPLTTGPTDLRGYRTVRREQGALRDWLLQGQDTGTCCLCGVTYPKRYLWASHLKPRAHCSDAERLDPAVVALMCRFGCDDLYEHGDIYVDQGVIRTRESLWNHSGLNPHLEALVGRSCHAYTTAAKPYFDWHASQPHPRSRGAHSDALE